MKQRALALSLMVALGAAGCGASRSSSHPMTPATAVMLGATAAGVVGLLIWAGSACDHCGDEYGPTEPRPYPYPAPGEW